MTSELRRLAYPAQLRAFVEDMLLKQFTKGLPMWDAYSLRRQVREDLIKDGITYHEAQNVLNLALQRLKRTKKLSVVNYEGKPKRGEHYLARFEVFSALAAEST